jgi:limbic system-associated membrane protein
MWSPVLAAILGVTCISIGVNGQAPTVTIMHTDPTTYNRWYITAFRDTDVVLDCYVENLPADTTVRWQRTIPGPNGTTLILSLSQDMGLEDNIHYSIERPTQFTWRMRIRAIQTTDIGQYQCFVLTTLNSRAQDIRYIDVVVRPTLDLQQTSSDMTVTEGDDVDLMCSATGRPMPVIEWTRLGGALLPIGQEKLMGSLLPIRDIKAEDRGIYRCVAQNSVGKDQTDITVSVRFAPIITTPREVIHQAIGYRVELQCYAESNPNPNAADATWVFGSSTFSVSSEGYDVRYVQGAFGRVTYELIIFSVQDSNYGNYVCRFKNSVGVTTRTITLAKTSEPQASVKLGQVIKGAAAGPSTPSVTLFALSCLLWRLLRTDN